MKRKLHDVENWTDGMAREIDSGTKMKWMKKILVIEDDEQDRKSILRVLKKAGFEEIASCETGREGIVMAECLRPDLVIVDTVLPDLDGFVVANEINAIQDLTVKIILCTGFSDAYDPFMAQLAGADNYMMKIAGFKNLLERVEELLAHTS
ncbi:MAG TPA: hypothetical protein DD723_06905 [Candidatus Omnitrophica bacterium]|uniref:Transcriptional regulatory protein n=1 Tax=Candidatus Kaiserbacteria bacterium GW2011_GWA2_49_19 TaxID=1618669 RepID=A0A0G1VR48_9BACT|nr:MAG: Transcriptional regulatory protein [Candidatus Kaiserbacteria bacterium GW2011_GWA2_49_19]OGX21723.1 MAG: hypothetical protein A2Y04_06215 [Omnitrophica WOR_2 bacterium GWC2_45_7]HBR15253.1 hypothetical protein [Candidatus Omnitrophota bacterium]